MAIDDGGVKIVKIVRGKMGFHVSIYREHDFNDPAKLPEMGFRMAYQQNSKGQVIDPREQVELFLMDFEMLPTWSWTDSIGQFAHKRNWKCSDRYSVTAR